MATRGYVSGGVNYDHIAGDQFTSASSSCDDYNPLVECGASNGFCGNSSSMLNPNCVSGFSQFGCQQNCFSGDACGPHPCCCEQQSCSKFCCVPNNCGSSMPCADNCSKVFKQVVHVGPPEPCHVVNRYRLPTPPPDRLDRTICMHQPQRIIHNIFQQPMKPPMVVRTNRMVGPSPPDEIHNHCEMVPHRCRQTQCCCYCCQTRSGCPGGCGQASQCQSACFRGRCGPGFASNCCNPNVSSNCLGGQCCCIPNTHNCCPVPFGCIPSC